MELIPGLNDDVANECLIRVPFDSFSTIASTCEIWRAHIHRPEFSFRRKEAGFSQPVFVMTQARVNPNSNINPEKNPPLPVFRLTVHEPGSDFWSELPPVQDYPDGLPLFCRVVGIRSGLVLLGGWHPKNLAVSNAVYIYDFITATWRRGEDMPGVRRSLFAATSDSDRTVFIAGGHDEEKNALRSGLMYDVENNKWVTLPDMAKERDECNAVFHCGKIHVISGYITDRQGLFENTAEAFDDVTKQWDPADKDFMVPNAMSGSTYVADTGGRLYTCRGSNIVMLENDTWKTVTELPVAVRNTMRMMTWKEKLLVIGFENFGGALSAYVLDIKQNKWTSTPVPEEFSGHVHSCCHVEL